MLAGRVVAAVLTLGVAVGCSAHHLCAASHEPCNCEDGRVGTRACRDDGVTERCVCTSAVVDAGPLDAGATTPDASAFDGGVDAAQDAPDASSTIDPRPPSHPYDVEAGRTATCIRWPVTPTSLTLCFGAESRCEPGWAMSIVAVTSADPGTRHGCALMPEGTVACFGAGGPWIGDGTSDLPDPTSLALTTDVVDIGVAGGATLAVRSDGSVVAWGVGLVLGAGAGEASVPVAVPGLVDAVIVDAAPRGDHACALRRGGRVSCWGLGRSGAIGNGATDDASLPVEVRGLVDVVEIGLGTEHSCAVHRDGGVSCWGANESGQLGTGDRDPRTTPTRVAGVDDAIAVTGGDGHTCVLHAGGTVSCWGANASGQLGLGSTDDALLATPVPALVDVVDLSAGSEHTCAVAADGVVWCAGRNDCGQAGGASDGAPLLVPTRVPGTPIEGPLGP